MREVIGHTEIASALAEGRGKIETDTQTLLQQILDSYHSRHRDHRRCSCSGSIRRRPVIDAFRDVQSAKIDQQRLINEAQAYSNNVVPVAHGDAARIVAGGAKPIAAGRAPGRRRRRALHFGLQRLQSGRRT